MSEADQEATLADFIAFCRAKQLSDQVIQKLQRSSLGEQLPWSVLRHRIVASRKPEWQRLLEEFESGRPSAPGPQPFPSVIAQGLNAYIFEIISALRRIARESQPVLERENSYYTFVARQGETEGNASLATVNDPFPEFRFAEKREIELETYYENKIANNRVREEQAREKERQLRERSREAGEEGQEVKKPEFNEDQEILKVLSRLKAERAKESGSAARSGQDQNEYIRYFMEGRTDSGVAEGDMLQRRETLENSGGESREVVFIRHKHLLHFLENDPYFRKSASLFKQYIKSSN